MGVEKDLQASFGWRGCRRVGAKAAPLRSPYPGVTADEKDLVGSLDVLYHHKLFPPADDHL
ncbi:MAG: hypothetical protein AVDCRST_MAG25-2503 [uncultured Rubrobacteraceae bacterium]|uniref:Uncharacterized protein n=1 Tax=uncultured Rubrobacteraceae bacterium TaxID=349277 RepID=A0A6J4RMD1_9ACTN|nr:MAG: hypothetical protein AVDCRST_MAG25-2503 [uncultured Rubrobacteraceae bacterium]